jgi:tRNA(fMet)-specific endonuclease VapC
VGLILDTNALSAIADGERGATEALGRASEVALPVIVTGEYRFGILQSRRRREYEGWLAEMIAACRLLTVTEETAQQYAELRLELKTAGTPLPSNDVWIAALARQHGLPILSRDAHFDVVRGLRRIAW